MPVTFLTLPWDRGLVAGGLPAPRGQQRKAGGARAGSALLLERVYFEGGFAVRGACALYRGEAMSRAVN